MQVLFWNESTEWGSFDDATAYQKEKDAQHGAFGTAWGYQKINGKFYVIKKVKICSQAEAL